MLIYSVWVVVRIHSLHLPRTYLGAKFKEKSVWEPIIERLYKMFSCWKAKYLTKGKY